MGVFDNSTFKILYGTVGTYFFAFINSILHEKILREPYLSKSTGQYHKFPYYVCFLIIPYFFGWILGNLITSVRKDGKAMPSKYLILCACSVVVGALSYNAAILLTSYPVVIMVKSCSILSVIIVGVCFSRVKDSKVKLGKNKLVVGFLVALGIVVFNLFGKSTSSSSSNSALGIGLLLVSLVADGFLPDFQAVLKTVYKPTPVNLMAQINKWVFIIALIYTVAIGEFMPCIEFLKDHPDVFIDLLINGFLTFCVQMFVYYIVQHFKQHVAPFVITIRKIFSVVFSILWFNHSVNHAQWLGILVVMSAAFYDFYSEKAIKEKQEAQKKERAKLQQKSTEAKSH